MSTIRHAQPHQVTQWSYVSGRRYEDPFNEVKLEVHLESESGTWRVPCFWAGDQEFTMRFAPPHPGLYRYRTVCSDESNPDLHGLEGTLEVSERPEDEPVPLGPICIKDDASGFVDAAGKDFFWLGDTWWMGFTKRLAWPDDFQRLAADRKAKGFNVIQIVAGLYPDMPWGDPRGENNAGLPWEKDFSRVNPAWFDEADLKLQYLVREGFIPCIVGCWGYFLPLMGSEKMADHWRYLVARWSAYPVVWCLAGEAAMPYYRSDDREKEIAQQKAGWTEIARYVRNVDPYPRPITIHPTQVGREQVEDDSVLDFDMLQTGHSGYESVPNNVRTVRKQHATTPKMPVVVGEVSYEGILHGTESELQRLMFWAGILSGAAGYTYGANGIWQVNQPGKPYGPSPHGGCWGNTPWTQAVELKGSTYVGLAAKILRELPFGRFEPHLDWVDPPAHKGDVFDWDNPPADTREYFQHYAAGLEDQVRLFYFWQPFVPWRDRPRVVKLDSAATYRACWIDPRSAERHDLGEISPDTDGTWQPPLQPEMSDWLLLVRRI